jgi:hypothetical protein
MTLIQQFPDISQTIRSKNKTGDRRYRSANAKKSLGYLESDAVARYYEGEFRRWHVKFLFIVAATLGITCVILLGSFWIYNLIYHGMIMLLFG